MGTSSQYSNNFSHNDSITPFSSSQNQHSFVHHQCISTFKGNTSHISSLTITPNFLYSGSSNKEIRVFTLSSLPNTPQPNNPPTIHTNFLLKTGKGAIKSLIISDSKLFTAHQDHKIRVFEIHNSHENQDFKLLTTLPTLTDRLLRFFPPKNHVQIRRHKKSTWVHHVDTVSALALSSDNSVLYSVSWDRTMKIWQTSDFRCLESITNAHDDAVNALALSNNGFVYTGSADKKIKVWSKGDDHHGEKKKKKKRKHSLLATLDKHKSVINALVISDDGSKLYSGGCDSMVLVWKIDDNLNSMDVVCELRGHRRAILCLGVVLDLICSGSADNSVRIWRRNSWDRSSYSCLAVLEGHRGPVKCLASAAATDDDDHHNNYNSTSVLVYSGSVDCDIKVWKIYVPSERVLI